MILMGILKQALSFLSSLIGLKNTKWKSQPIPNKAILYRRIHFRHVKEDVQGSNGYIPIPSFLKDPELSCDWNRYSTPSQSLQLISQEYKGETKKFKDANIFFIAGFLVQEIFDNNIIEKSIIHDPIQFIPEIIGTPNNRAHTLIKDNREIDGERAVKIRLLLSKIAKWEIFDEDKLKELQSNRP